MSVHAGGHYASSSREASGVKCSEANYFTASYLSCLHRHASSLPLLDLTSQTQLWRCPAGLLRAG